MSLYIYLYKIYDEITIIIESPNIKESVVR